MNRHLALASACLLLVSSASAETIYKSFNFATPWADVSFADAVASQPLTEDLRVLAQLDGGKVKPLFPRIG